MIPLIETLETSLWLKFLIDVTMKSVVIFGVAGFGSDSFCVAGQRRCAVWFGVWQSLGCLIIPLFSLTLPQWKVNVLPATPEGI